MKNVRPTALPANVQKYRETNEFNQNTVPKGLLADHNTADGVWGVLRVLEGHLLYTRKNQPAISVTPHMPSVIFPKEKHHITCDTPVRFKVEFYRVAE